MDPVTMDRPATSGGETAHMSSSPAQTPPSAAPITSIADLKSRKRKPQPVVVEGWGTAYMASLTQGQWEDLNDRHQGPDGKTKTDKGYMSEAVAAGLRTPAGDQLYEDAVEGGKDVRALDLPVVAKLFESLATQSGLTAEARENLGKDSAPTP